MNTPVRDSSEEQALLAYLMAIPNDPAHIPPGNPITNPRAETHEILLRFIEESWTHARHIEDQRATITNFVIIIAAAIYGLLTQTGFSAKSLPITILLIAIGIYSMLACVKLYERYEMSTHRARKLRRYLDKLYPETRIRLLQNEADEEHNRKRRVLMRLRLNKVWVTLHFFIAISGVVYTLMSILP